MSRLHMEGKNERVHLGSRASASGNVHRRCSCNLHHKSNDCGRIMKTVTGWVIILVMAAAIVGAISVFVNREFIGNSCDHNKVQLGMSIDEFYQVCGPAYQQWNFKTADKIEVDLYYDAMRSEFVFKGLANPVLVGMEWEGS